MGSVGKWIIIIKESWTRYYINELYLRNWFFRSKTKQINHRFLRFSFKVRFFLHFPQKGRPAVVHSFVGTLHLQKKSPHQPVSRIHKPVPREGERQSKGASSKARSRDESDWLEDFWRCPPSCAFSRKIYGRDYSMAAQIKMRPAIFLRRNREQAHKAQTKRIWSLCEI